MRAVDQQKVLNARGRILLAQPLVLTERAAHRMEQDQAVSLAARIGLV